MNAWLSFAEDAAVAGFISEVRREMDGIAHAAVRFVNTYAVPSFTPELKASFAEELSAIGNVLVKPPAEHDRSMSGDHPFSLAA